jgi:hypothetical protein
VAAVDFGEWAVPGLELTFGGDTYVVSPPTVEDSKKLLAAAVRAEVGLGLVKGEIPDEIAAVLATIQPGEHPALGAVYEVLAAAGVPQATIDRMGYYATFYWARGKAYADALAGILWGPAADPVEGEAGDDDPKG